MLVSCLNLLLTRLSAAAVPRKVLKDRYETAPEADEPQQTDLDLDQDELYDEDQFYKESEAIPPAPKVQGANVGRSFDFDTSNPHEEATSTLLPPLLSRNDANLEGKFRQGVYSLYPSPLTHS